MPSEESEGIVACSPMTGRIYLVTDWEEGDDGGIVSEEKQTIYREDIPEVVSIEEVHGAARISREKRVKA